MCVKRGTANMGQWSAKLTFHFNLALGEWEGGGEFQELGNLHISIEFIHFFVDGFAMRSTLGEWKGGRRVSRVWKSSSIYFYLQSLNILNASFLGSPSA